MLLSKCNSNGFNNLSFVNSLPLSSLILLFNCHTKSTTKFDWNIKVQGLQELKDFYKDFLFFWNIYLNSYIFNKMKRKINFLWTSTLLLCFTFRVIVMRGKFHFSNKLIKDEWPVNFQNCSITKFWFRCCSGLICWMPYAINNGTNLNCGSVTPF